MRTSSVRVSSTTRPWASSCGTRRLICRTAPRQASSRSSTIFAWWSSPRSFEFAARGGAESALAPRGPCAHAAEQFGEEVAEIGGAGIANPRPENSNPASQSGGGREASPGAVAARQPVIGGALFGIGQHRIGLVDLAHARLGVGLLAHVGVVLARELAEGLLDLLGGRIARHAQHW
jgi:hypothetical protein